MQTLVIVESPSKAKTIEKYLGKDYKVLSSVGHIRDLATTGQYGLGVDVTSDFKPEYKFIKGKKKVFNELVKEKKSSIKVLLATDPDREGEAISWHLAEVLNLDFSLENRIVFNEITKQGIEKGMKDIRKIDLDLVHSQESRRIVDRIIGFRLSSLLKKKIKAQSAGRVQSVALRMIVEREEEIQKFIPKEYWKLLAEYKKLEFDYEKNSKKLEKKEIDKLFDKLGDDKKLKVIDIVEKTKKRNPYKIFTTSTMQQTASSRLNFTSKKTMQVAQKLYEGKDIGSGLVGLITYMRTDSTRISSDIEKNIYGFISGKYGKEYVGYYIQKKISGSQDAHEGVRPTDVNNTPDKIKKYLTSDEFKLYKLIWTRTVMAHMKAADIKSKTYKLEHTSGIIFQTTSSSVTFSGFLVLDETNEKFNEINLKKDEEISVDKFKKTQHFTQPKPRFTEAKLIKELEENGVGRPSTYATIIDILKKRNYVTVEKKAFIPTDEGILVTQKLKEYFKDFIDVKYTAGLENELDKVADGKKKELDLLTEFYNYFTPLYDNANEKMEKIESQKIGRKCPECGKDLVERKSKYGTFIGCSGYPECKYNEIEKKIITKCPKCKEGNIIEKFTKKKKIFYACDRFPACDYAVWNKEDIGKKMTNDKKKKGKK